MTKDFFQKVVPFIPLMAVLVLLLLKPYYIFPTTGDIDYHLIRAQEILQNPFMAFSGLSCIPTRWQINMAPSIIPYYTCVFYGILVAFAHSLLSVFQIL
jgi:hypothetical protein